MSEGKGHASVGDEAGTLKAELKRFRRDMKIALVLQAIFIVGATVSLLKLLP